MSPIYTAAIQPASIDTCFFVNREQKREQIKKLLKAYLTPKKPQTGRFLIRGDRGIGKSILVRQVLEDLSQEVERLLCIVVDGRAVVKVRGLLQNVCEVTQLKAEEVFPNEQQRLKGQAAILAHLAPYEEMNVSQLDTTVRGFNLGAEISGPFMSLLTGLLGKVGVGYTRSAQQALGESLKLKIDEDFLRRALHALYAEIVQEGFRVLVFLDNLDQIAVGDPEAEVKTVTEFLKQFIFVEGCVIITTLRSEFVSPDLTRETLESIVIEDFPREQMLNLIRKRIEFTDEGERRSIEDSALWEIAEKLKEATGNPLTFLKWIHFLLNNSEMRPETLLADLEWYALQFFGMVPLEVIKKITGIFFFNPDRKFLDRDLIINDAKITPEEFSAAERARVVVADDLAKKTSYTLTPDLVFFKLAAPSPGTP